MSDPPILDEVLVEMVRADLALRVLGARRKRLLDLPYGAAAERLRLWRAEQLQAPPGDPPNGDPPPDADERWDNPLAMF